MKENEGKLRKIKGKWKENKRRMKKIKKMDENEKKMKENEGKWMKMKKFIIFKVYYRWKISRYDKWIMNFSIVE